MPILPILEIPHPILRKKAKKVRSISKKELTLAYNMVDTMREAGGVGLAANQIGELWRIIVLQMPDEEESRIYFNPQIIKAYGSREVEEGCLSIPGYRVKINRSVEVRVRAQDSSGKEFKVKIHKTLML